MKMQFSRIKNGAMVLLFLAAYSLSAVTPFINTSAAYADAPPVPPAPPVHKSYVCKYVGTPGVDERLQTGGNPTHVDNNSLPGYKVNQIVKVGDVFGDKHDKSVVIVANTEKLNPEPGIGQCPAPDGPDEVPIPAKPGFTDPCGDGKSTWIIPDDTASVTWKLDKHGNLIASTTKGYTFPDDKTSYSFGKAPDSGKDCPVLVQPPEPVVKDDKCGTSKDTFTVPDVAGVNYYLQSDMNTPLPTGVNKTKGLLSVTIVAIADEGSGYTKDNSWTLTFTNKPCEEGPIPIPYPSPTTVCVPGANNDEVTLPPAMDHVTLKYSKDWKNNKFVVTAKTDHGYYFQDTNGKTELKWKLVDYNTECGGGQGEGQKVVPVEPTVLAVCGPDNDTVTLPSVDNVKYTQTGWVGGKNTVTATADTGFYFVDGEEHVTTMQWTYTDANTPCGNVLGDTTPTPNVPIVTPAPAQLADTGNNVMLPMLLSTGILGLAVMTIMQKGGTRRNSRIAAFLQRAADRLTDTLAQPFAVPAA